MQTRDASARLRILLLCCWAAMFVAQETSAQEPKGPTTQERPEPQESAERHAHEPISPLPAPPALPEGMTLDEVLEHASQPPPEHYPDPVPDDEIRMFLLAEQLEYRWQDQGPDQLGWEAQGWIGFDFDRIWFKAEGENAFDHPDEGESEIDLLYSRLITPFWNAQIGAQYAIGWADDKTSDRWSGVLALQGLAPGMIELDSSFYLSESGDLTVEIEGEYNIRVTQRLVLQPRIELGFAAQDVSDRGLGAGMTDANLDLRLRYETRREIAPYLGVRYRTLVGETADKAEASGSDDDQVFFFVGLRLAY